MEQDTSTMSSPFWVPNENRRKLRRSYSLLLTSTSFLVLLLVIALALVFGLIIISTLRSFTSNIFKPNAVKHSWDSLWDSLTLILVLFFFDKTLILVLFAVVCGFLTKNDNNETKTPPPTSWYEQNNNGFRSFESYHDLRQYSPVTVGDDDEGFVGSGEESSQPPTPPPMPAVRKKKRGIAIKENVATVAYASPVIKPDPEPQPPPSAPPLPPLTRTKAVRRNANSKRAYRAEMTEKLKRVLNIKKKEFLTSLSKKKEFLTSLIGKKKKQRQRSVENFEILLRNSQPVSQSPPPPPPPPPPPSVFGNDSPLIPMPPPPPPPPFQLPAWKFRVQGDYVRVDSIGSSRSGSPDFDEAVESPTSQEEEEEASQCSNNNSPFAANFEDHVTETASTSASPDVDTKAQNFIKNFRAGLRIAKMNSMKEKQGIGRSKLSNLGPLQNP